MRHIGNLPNESQARTFADHLVASGIRNEIEADGAEWQVWIFDEDDVPQAQTFLTRFRENPAAEEFQHATAGAAKARAAAAADLESYRKRVRTRASVFPKFGGHGIGILTYALIFACLICAFYTGLESDRNIELLRQLFISDPLGNTGQFLPEVRAGEVWRLLTPIFIHFGYPHIIFNTLCLFQFGCMIEGRQGINYFAALVAVTGIISNVAQYYLHGAAFGGMSGVVYALAGYAWMRGKYDQASGIGLDSQSVTFMLIWLVVCFTGLVGPIANTAHVAGLISGMAWGRIAAYNAMRHPK